MSDKEDDVQDPIDMNTTENSNKQEKEKDVEEKEETNDTTEVDIAFVLDCTGSMNSYIKSAQDNIISIANQLSEEEGCDVRFALVAFRDIPPQETSFITDIVHFTSVPLLISLKLNKLQASGGGDAPEALTTALHKARYSLSWRQDSIKIIIVIGDAAPHGIETSGDGFPNGDLIVDNNNNNKNDKNEKYYNVIDILSSIRNDLNGSIYSVGCEPTLSCSFNFARDFYEYMSDYTHGRYLPLSNATLLPKVVIGSIKEQIMSHELMKNLENEMKKIKDKYGDDIDDNKMNELIADKWKENGIKTKNVSIGSLYRSERPRDNINLLMNDQIVKSLKDFKKHCKVLQRPKKSDFRHLVIDHGRSGGRRTRSVSRSRSRSRDRSRDRSRSRSRDRDRDRNRKRKSRYNRSREESEDDTGWGMHSDDDNDNDDDDSTSPIHISDKSRARSRSRSPQRVYVKSEALSNKDVGRVISQWKSRNRNQF